MVIFADLEHSHALKRFNSQSDMSNEKQSRKEYHDESDHRLDAMDPIDIDEIRSFTEGDDLDCSLLYNEMDQDIVEDVVSMLHKQEYGINKFLAVNNDCDTATPTYVVSAFRESNETDSKNVTNAFVNVKTNEMVLPYFGDESERCFLPFDTYDSILESTLAEVAEGQCDAFRPCHPTLSLVRRPVLEGFGDNIRLPNEGSLLISGPPSESMRQLTDPNCFRGSIEIGYEISLRPYGFSSSHDRTSEVCNVLCLEEELQKCKNELELLRENYQLVWPGGCYAEGHNSKMDAKACVENTALQRRSQPCRRVSLSSSSSSSSDCAIGNQMKNFRKDRLESMSRSQRMTLRHEFMRQHQQQQKEIRKKKLYSRGVACNMLDRSFDASLQSKQDVKQDSEMLLSEQKHKRQGQSFSKEDKNNGLQVYRTFNSFPARLMKTFLDLNDETIVAWLNDGRSFVVVDPTNITSLHLHSESTKKKSHCKYESFIRRLFRWGFVRIAPGTGIEAFHHPLFHRDYPQWTMLMTVKESSSKSSSVIRTDNDITTASPSLTGIEKFLNPGYM